MLLGTDKPGSKENSEQVQGTMKIFKAAKVRGAALRCIASHCVALYCISLCCTVFHCHFF